MVRCKLCKSSNFSTPGIANMPLKAREMMAVLVAIHIQGKLYKFSQCFFQCFKNVLRQPHEWHKCETYKINMGSIPVIQTGVFLHRLSWMSYLFEVIDHVNITGQKYMHCLVQALTCQNGKRTTRSKVLHAEAFSQLLLSWPGNELLEVKYLHLKVLILLSLLLIDQNTSHNCF